MDRPRRVPLAHLAVFFSATVFCASCGSSQPTSHSPRGAADPPNVRSSLAARPDSPLGADVVTEAARYPLPKRSDPVDPDIKSDLKPGDNVMSPPALIEVDAALALLSPHGRFRNDTRSPSAAGALHPPVGDTSILSNRQAAHHPAAAAQLSLAPPERGILPFASMPAPRSPQMEQVARRADQHSRRGFDLAGRKAYYSARSEFVQALRAIAQALDAQSGTAAHTAALIQGLRALEESDDFVATGSLLETHIDVAAIVDGHRTPLLQDTELRGVSPLVALQRYYTYAQEQLGVAVGHELAGSMALHGLGKVRAALAAQDTPGVSGEAKAIVLQRAALLVYPGNYMAANDLGVLLARVGRYAEAREALMQSLSVAEHPETWNNLAVVHRSLGENQLAQLARHEAGLAAAARGAGANSDSPAAGMVNWLPPSQFAGTSAVQNATAPATGRTEQNPAFDSPPRADEQSSGQGIMSWLPWKFKRE